MNTSGIRVAAGSAGLRGMARHQEDERVAFFEDGTIRDISLELSPGSVARIQDPKRPYVHASLFENGRLVYRDVAVKIKGAAGSTRPWTDRPALTINTDKYQKGQSYRGLDKFHLNNAVQDPSLLHDWISSVTFRSAGYAAARVSYARVRLNGRDVGMYVLKEGFDGGFLRANFAKPDGNLYDGGFVQDVDADLQRDEGQGPEDKADLKALVAACRIGNPVERWKTLASRLDIPSFLTFMAIERMLCHWDGYCLNVNNYRLYFDPTGTGY
ncbi:MAG: CotH kinase family protein, partial [Armatimonadaceae bacterium]